MHMAMEGVYFPHKGVDIMTSVHVIDRRIICTEELDTSNPIFRVLTGKTVG